MLFKFLTTYLHRLYSWQHYSDKNGHVKIKYLSLWLVRNYIAGLGPLLYCCLIVLQAFFRYTMWPWLSLNPQNIAIVYNSFVFSPRWLLIITTPKSFLTWNVKVYIQVSIYKVQMKVRKYSMISNHTNMQRGHSKRRRFIGRRGDTYIHKHTSDTIGHSHRIFLLTTFFYLLILRIYT